MIIIMCNENNNNMCNNINNEIMCIIIICNNINVM